MSNEKDDKPKRRRYGGPPPKGLENRKDSGTLCTARRKHTGLPCTNFAMAGSTVCRMHGGAAPQVRAAAHVRLLMQSDVLMAALLKIAKDEKVPVQHRLVAIRDGLDRADLSGKTSVEVTVEKGKSFEDFVGEAIIDVEAEDDEPLDTEDIVDAELVDDEPPLQNRHDRAAFREADRAAELRQMTSNRAETEQQKLEGLRRHEPAEDRSDVTRGREAYLNALDNGASVKRAQAAAERASKGEPSTGIRRARSSEATISRKRRGER